MSHLPFQLFLREQAVFIPWRHSGNYGSDSIQRQNLCDMQNYLRVVCTFELLSLQYGPKKLPDIPIVLQYIFHIRHLDDPTEPRR